MGFCELTSYKYLVTGNGQVGKSEKVAFIGLAETWEPVGQSGRTKKWLRKICS